MEDGNWQEREDVTHSTPVGFHGGPSCVHPVPDYHDTTPGPYNVVRTRSVSLRSLYFPPVTLDSTRQGPRRGSFVKTLEISVDKNWSRPDIQTLVRTCDHREYFPLPLTFHVTLSVRARPFSLSRGVGRRVQSIAYR